MKDMYLDIDTELAASPLTLRERMAIRILFLMFMLLAPVKYQHQVKNLLEEFWK